MKNLLVAGLITLTVGLTAEAKSHSNSHRAEAKKQCLEGDPSLSGKKLQKCIKKLSKK